MTCFDPAAAQAACSTVTWTEADASNQWVLMLMHSSSCVVSFLVFPCSILESRKLLLLGSHLYAVWP
jgi:hypothetical protein